MKGEVSEVLLKVANADGLELLGEVEGGIYGEGISTILYSTARGSLRVLLRS